MNRGSTRRTSPPFRVDSDTDPFFEDWAESGFESAWPFFGRSAVERFYQPTAQDREQANLFLADLIGKPATVKTSGQANPQYSSPIKWTYSRPESRLEMDELIRAENAEDSPKDITRWDIFVPVSDATMKQEAVTDIDPFALPPVEPSWRLDGLAWVSTTSPSHFIAVKMGQLSINRTEPFDTRVYYCHPLDVRFYGYPVLANPPTKSPGSTAQAPTTRQNKPHPTLCLGTIKNRAVKFPSWVLPTRPAPETPHFKSFLLR
ncbi:MAG: hypothetical protein IPK82_40320 [Polyangiaceae bacterium]|nr:hypothetical protein [Polyangiaceae bacterium]